MFCDFLMTCNLWKMMYMCLQVSTLLSKKILTKTRFFVGILKATDKKSKIRIRSLVYGSKDPDPSRNVTDPEHCFKWTMTFSKDYAKNWALTKNPASIKVGFLRNDVEELAYAEICCESTVFQNEIQNRMCNARK